ncbi:MAG: MotE family protein [Candidatus Caldatribacteriaceae bacterium]
MARVETRTNPKKRPRIAQEKKDGLVSPVSAGKSPASRKNAGETFMYLLIFGLVSVLFLNFMGIVKIPFLQFLRLEGKGGPGEMQDVFQNVVPSQAEEQRALYQGPQLAVVEKQEVQASPAPVEGGPGNTVTETEDGIEVTVETETPPPGAQGREQSPSSLGEDQASTLTTVPENVYRLAKIYSAMDPQEAVRILEKFSDEEVVVILSSMKERQVAEILKVFPVDRAVGIARKMMKGR